MAPTASTLYKQQSRYNGKLTREYSSTGTGTIYWSSSDSLGITAGWFQIDAENTKGEELFITGITGTPAEYSGTVVIRGLRDYGANTNVPAKQFVHRATASIIISDNHSWQDQMVDTFLAHEQLQGAFHGFAGIGTTASRPAAAAGNNGMLYWSSDDLVLYYSNGTTWTAQAAGTQPDASDSVKGVSKLSVAASDPVNPIVVGDNDPRVVTGTTAQRGVFIEASAANIIAGTQTHGSGVELTVNPKFLADASVSTSAGVGDANKYLRLNASGALSNTLTGVSFTAGNSGAQGDLLEVTASNTASSLKRKIVATKPSQATLTNDVSPDTNVPEYNNLGRKAVFTSATSFVSLYPGDDSVRYANWTYNTFLKTWGLVSVAAFGASPQSFSTASVLSTNPGNIIVLYRSSTNLYANNTLVATSVNAPDFFGLCNLTAQYALLLYCKSGTGFEAIALRHDGVLATQNITTGSATTISSYTSTPSNFTAIQLGVNKALLVFSNSARTALMGMVVTVSGTTITTNAAYTIATYNTSYIGPESGVRFNYSFYKEQGVADKAIISFYDTSAVQSVLINVSGTTFTTTAMTGVPNQNVYSLLSKDVVLIGTSLTTMKGYYIDATNFKYTEITETCAIPNVSTLMSMLYSSSECIAIGQATTLSSLQLVSAQHPAPLVALSAYTNAGTVVATNRGEVTVPAISGSAGDIQYLTFSGTSNTRINEATVLGVAKNATTIILS